ncbi:MAG: YWFCY domain-containing protein [Flavisolibacter sp.]|nr:YWFCY domain-containing protein [Flavisolibacter sp.]
MHTGENEQGLRKIVDMTRLISLVILCLHFYYYCYGAFKELGWTAKISDQLLINVSHTSLFGSFNKSKLIALGFLLISLLGAKGKKNEKLNYKTALAYFLIGVLFYFGSYFVMHVDSFSIAQITVIYIGITLLGFISILTGGGLITRIIKNRLNPDVFNKSNETFPQEERLLTNEYSINLPALYNLKGRIRKSWISFINPMRGLLVIGSPGAGKSYFVIEQVIKQHIEKGFSMFIYDYKYDDLTKIAYNHYLKHRNKYVIPPSFYCINFDDLTHSHCCNPLDPANMHDITDAVEAARVIMLGLNRAWIKRQGEFFVESPINFLTALIWFLKKYQDGEYCTLPHVIELMQIDLTKLFTVLRIEPEISAYINPFISAYQADSMEQLEGQIDAARIGLARLSSPTLYYVLSGNDFFLDVNNPNAPKIVILANNPQKQEVYGPVLSLYVTRMSKIVNKKNQMKMNVVIDEFPTITLLNFETLIATGRSNKIATTLAMQDASQLKLNYGKEWAEVVVNTCGNIIVGQIRGELAKTVSETLGKTLQDRESISINSNDTSVSKSKQLEAVVPVSTIANLSSGEFVGMVADNPDQIIDLKTFHARIVSDHEANKKEKEKYVSVPALRNIDQKDVNVIYQIIKQDVQDIVEDVMEEVLNDPEKAHLAVRKE